MKFFEYIIGIYFALPGEASAAYNDFQGYFRERPPELLKALPAVPPQSAWVKARRLSAESERPQRNLYVAEHAGLRWQYEYAGEYSEGVEVLNIDEETSVVGLACHPVQDRPRGASVAQKRIRLGLRWLPGTAPGLNGSSQWRRGLEPGDVIQGSAAWNCQGGDFLMEIVEVLEAATAVDPIYTVVARPTSHLEVVRDIYVDLRLSESDSLPRDRRLEWDTVSIEKELLLPGAVSQNYDEEKQRVHWRNREFGPLSCVECYARFAPTIQFVFKTSSFEITEVAVYLDVQINFTMSIGLSEYWKTYLQNIVGSWETSDTRQRVKEWEGPDLGNMLGSIPLFGNVMSALQIGLTPVVAFEYLLSANDSIDLNGLITAHAGAWGRLGVQWTKEEGVKPIFDLGHDYGLNFTGDAISAPISAGVFICFGIKLEILGTTVTRLEVCPGFEQSLEFSDVAKAIMAPATMEPVSAEVDTRICFEFHSFRTNMDLDTGMDSPWAQGCTGGACVQTADSWSHGWSCDCGFPCFCEHDTFEFPDPDAGSECIKTSRKALEINDVSLTVHEGSYFEQYVNWPDIYTKPYSFSLREKCQFPFSDCDFQWTVQMEPTIPGKEAELSVRIFTMSIESRRLTDSALLGPECTGLSSAFSPSLASSFDGIHKADGETNMEVDLNPAGRGTPVREEPDFACTPGYPISVEEPGPFSENGVLENGVLIAICGIQAVLLVACSCCLSFSCWIAKHPRGSQAAAVSQSPDTRKNEHHCQVEEEEQPAAVDLRDVAVAVVEEEVAATETAWRTQHTRVRWSSLAEQDAPVAATLGRGSAADRGDERLNDLDPGEASAPAKPRPRGILSCSC